MLFLLSLVLSAQPPVRLQYDAANNLGGTWKAWLSDSFGDAIDHCFEG